ncbi:Late competence protein ComGC, access of DNA to ComEA [Ligilactobacillus salivarius str. Ren]|nr:Late competence protein ComGC, access of DNA to ComEA [Ligilactobacillus salivarius str. Ren]
MDEKNTNTVTIDELKSANYLNNDQYDQIKKKNIEIKLDNGKKE